MGGLAQIARALGHTVTGSDAGVYPPMSTQLEQAGIALFEGWDARHLQPRPDQVVIGNALSRGNVEVEAVLNAGIPYVSGAQWLAEQVLYQDRWTLAVAGTHGKTSTTAMLTWILEQAGLKPGFLVGGVPLDFGISARLGEGRHFVVEADEYDTAFFDKRSKFVHYRPRTLILNNLEFDHADIFDDLAAIQRQFHHLLRTVPAEGEVISNAADANLEAVLERGCWSDLVRIGVGGEWQARALNEDASHVEIIRGGTVLGDFRWSQLGRHNMHNALAAVVASQHVGVQTKVALEALSAFGGIKRRLELRGEVRGVRVYDDFAHHPTAIQETVTALRARVGDSGRLIAVLEPRSNTMRLGVHQQTLAPSLAGADQIVLVRPDKLDWNIEAVAQALQGRATVLHSVEVAVDQLTQQARAGDHILIMSNGSFGGIHEKLLAALQSRRV